MTRVNNKIDSVALSKKDNHSNWHVLYRARTCWDSMDKFRIDRRRCIDYQHGKQWDDYITVNGRKIKEEQFLRDNGHTPLKNNLIDRLVRSVLGVFRSQSKEPTCVARDRQEQSLGEAMSVVLQYNGQLNRLDDLYARTLEDFLCGGLAVHRKSYGWRRRKLDCWTDYVNPNRFFVDGNMEDFRTWDANIIGQIHDLSFQELCAEFATCPEDYDTLRKEYRNARDENYIGRIGEGFGYSDMKNLDFFIPNDHAMCRVIEVWTKEQKSRYRCHDYAKGTLEVIEIEQLEEIKQENSKRINMARQAGVSEDDIQDALENGESLARNVRLIHAEFFVDDYWYFRFMTPTGKILKEGETPYAHGEHPYVFRCYPFLDGEIHSFVSNIIDQQRYINRLITLNDFIIQASAKGVLLIPEEALGANRPEDFAEQWAKFNGVIVYKSKGGVEAPKQVANNSTQIGIHELLQLELQFMEDGSGVHGALQGKPGASAVSGIKYQQETQNATVTLLDILDTYDGFIKDCAYKDVENIKQFYEDEKVFNIAGRPGSYVTYNPSLMSDVEYDFAIEESSASAAYRERANEFLLQLYQTGSISVNDLLDFGNFPFGDALSQRIASRNEQQAAAQQEMQQAAGAPVDMEAVPSGEQQQAYTNLMVS